MMEQTFMQNTSKFTIKIKSEAKIWTSFGFCEFYVEDS